MIDVKLFVFPNAYCSMVVKELERVTEDKAVQLANAYSPILVTVLGMMTEVSP